MLAGEQFAAGPGIATVLADFDFETISFAGYVWVEPADDNLAPKKLGKWESLPGFSTQKRGLKAVGVRPYVEHETFRPLLLAYDLKDGHGARQWEWGQPFDVLQPLFDHIKAGKLLEAHNVGFEWSVWQYYCVPVLGWPSLDPNALRCSAAKSRANAYPGALADVGKVTRISKQKDPMGDRLMKLFSIPRNPTKKDPRVITLPHEAPDDWAAYKFYNIRDIEAEAEVSLKSPDLSPLELEVWQCDQRINDRGIQVDIVAVENCIAIVEQAYAKYGDELRALTGGIEPTELQQLQGWLKAQGVTIWSMDEDGVEAAVQELRGYSDMHEGELNHFAAAYRVLEIRQMLGSASVKKLYALRASVDKHGRVHDLYMYHAARTGRVIGQGVQPTNLYKGTWNNIKDIERALEIISSRCLELVEYEYSPKLSALDVVNNCLRSLFIAAPGKVLVSSDYSAIEGVVAAALAGCEWRLDVFRTHGMIYETSAARITGVPFEDFVAHRVASGGVVTRTDDGTLLGIMGGKHHPMRNKQGKFAELSLGFGGWIGAMKGFGADEFLTEDEMKKVILAWRDASPELPEMWGGQSRGRFDSARPELFGLEGCMVSAVLNPGQAFYYRGIGYQVHNDVLYCLLPSGRMLTYHEPRLAPSTRPYANSWELELTYSGWNSNPLAGPLGWERMKLYGGKAFENVVQAVARDIQAWAVVQLERKGWPVVMQTYDEGVTEVPIDPDARDADGNPYTVEVMEAIMMDVPAWARGWPIKAKGGWQCGRYGKFD